MFLYMARLPSGHFMKNSLAPRFLIVVARYCLKFDFYGFEHYLYNYYADLYLYNFILIGKAISMPER